MKKKKCIAIARSLALGAVGYFLAREYKNDYHRKWYESERRIVGTVLDSTYTNNTYSLRLLTEDGKILGLSVIDGSSVKKEALEKIVTEGSVVSFPVGNYIGWKLFWGQIDRNETYFNENTEIGTKRADRLEIIGQR